VPKPIALVQLDGGGLLQIGQPGRKSSPGVEVSVGKARMRAARGFGDFCSEATLAACHFTCIRPSIQEFSQTGVVEAVSRSGALGNGDKCDPSLLQQPPRCGLSRHTGNRTEQLQGAVFLGRGQAGEQRQLDRVPLVCVLSSPRCQ
jgi:hypothetical protein